MTLSDAYVTTFFKTAVVCVEALERDLDDAIARSAAARTDYSYSGLPGPGRRIFEQGVVFDIWRVLLRSPEYYVRWEHPYKGLGQRMDLAFFDPAVEDPLLLACVEAKWWDAIGDLNSDMARMLGAFPQAAVRKFELVFGHLAEIATPERFCAWVDDPKVVPRPLFRPHWYHCFRVGPKRYADHEVCFYMALLEVR